MELIAVLLVACALAIPVVAIIALVRTKELREQLHDQSYRLLVAGKHRHRGIVLN